MSKNLQFLLLLAGFCAFTSTDVVAQRAAPVNVILSPEIKDQYAHRAIYSAVRETVSNASTLYHQVEREDYEAIQKERTAAAKRKDDPYVATILKGAAVGIKFRIEEYVEQWDSVRVNDVLYGRDYDYSLTIKCVFNLQVTDIATSELLDSEQFTVTGTHVRIQKKFVELQKHMMRVNALGYVRRGVRKAVSRYLLQAVNPAVPVYQHAEGDNSLFIVAGGKGVYPKGTKFRLIRESTVMVNGRAILRQETVGKGTTVKNHKQYSTCLLNELKKGVAPQDLARYVIPSPENDIPTEWDEKPAPPKK